MKFVSQAFLFLFFFFSPRVRNSTDTTSCGALVNHLYVEVLEARTALYCEATGVRDFETNCKTFCCNVLAKSKYHTFMFYPIIKSS